MKSLFVEIEINRVNCLGRFNPHRLKLFGLLLFTIISPSLHAQNTEPPLDCFLRKDSVQNFLVVELPDTILVSNIEVNIGSSTDTDDLVGYTFVYDQSNGLPNGYSYLRTGTMLILGVGLLETSSIVYSRVRLQYSNSTWSNWLQFISN